MRYLPVVAACWISLVLSLSPLAAQTPAPAEPESLPSWVLLGLGKKAAEQKNYGQAIVYLRQAVDRRGIYPEAEAELARVTGLNGDPALQEALLLKALDEEGLLIVPEDRYRLLYALADLRLQTDRGLSREKGEAALETWRQILQDDRAYRQAEESGGIEGYYNALLTRVAPVNLKTASGPGLASSLTGLNRVFFLYHHPLTFSLRAHQEIAALSLENKAYKKAVAHCLFALTGIFSTVFDEIQTLHPNYVFRDLKELFQDVNSPVFLGNPEVERQSSAQAGAPNPGWLSRYQPLWDYLETSGTNRTLTILARALDGLHEKATAAEIRQWRSLLFPGTSEALSRG